MAAMADSKPLLPALVPGALDGLLDGVGGDDAEMTGTSWSPRSAERPRATALAT
jgi:hypothetical protein